MKIFIPLFGLLLLILPWHLAYSQNLLFDDSDIIVRAAEDVEQSAGIDSSANAAAAADAKALLKQAPRKLTAPRTSQFKSSAPVISKSTDKLTFPAPFGLLWNAGISSTRNQGVELTKVEMKDYPDSFLANRLPKKLDFFERVYVSFGKTDELWRILAYSSAIEDEPDASKTLHIYKTYSEYLNKKYGNMDQMFTPAQITKTIKDAQGKEQTITEEAPLGNPDFLNQLAAGTAVLYSTYHNSDISATLSIEVDGDKKSYIVIDYSNLKIIQQQENTTLDAL
ncbi:MAG: hypothetical protein IJ184_00655 [Alphaproteobacteria bacterium]|nr:hypothetical protein [Alphaproteobacteria bacterium]